MVEDIDRDYGSVLAALEHVGQNLDDWIIIYTSDHGEMLGERRLWEKSKFFEGSVKVPLIIRLPGGANAGRVVEENVNFCDLFATICELTDVPAVDGLDSRSLVPLLNGDGSNWNNETISHFGGIFLGHEEDFERFGNLMIKQDDLKYQYYGMEMPEVLFDLAADPGETVNFIGDPATPMRWPLSAAAAMNWATDPMPIAGLQECGLLNQDESRGEGAGG